MTKVKSLSEMQGKYEEKLTAYPSLQARVKTLEKIINVNDSKIGLLNQ